LIANKIEFNPAEAPSKGGQLRTDLDALLGREGLFRIHLVLYLGELFDRFTYLRICSAK
jgi:hypothetical protein